MVATHAAPVEAEPVGVCPNCGARGGLLVPLSKCASFCTTCDAPVLNSELCDPSSMATPERIHLDQARGSEQ